MLDVRTRLMSAGFALVLLAPEMALAQAETPAQRVCGKVVSLACDHGREIMAIVLEPGVLTWISAERSEDVPALKAATAPLLFRNVCVEGRPTASQSATSAGRFQIGSATAVFPETGSTPDWPTDGLYSECDGVVLPQVTMQVRPNYTESALSAHIQGIVLVQVLVDATGKVSRTRLVRSLDPLMGLDAEALKAAAQWRFRPATKDGRPVATTAMMELTFVLRSNAPPK